MPDKSTGEMIKLEKHHFAISILLIMDLSNIHQWITDLMVQQEIMPSTYILSKNTEVEPDQVLRRRKKNYQFFKK